MKIFQTLLVALLVVFCPLAYVHSNGANTDFVLVQPGQSIQAAIDRVPAGAVICLAEGTWSTQLEITKPLTLRGAGASQTILRGSSRNQPTILICGGMQGSSGLVKVSDLSVRGNYEGIMVLGVASADITHCDVSNNYWGGITATDDTQVTIRGCTIAHHHDTGIGIAGRAQVTITNCEITDNHWGVLLNQSSFTTLSQVIVQSNEWGIWARADSCGVIHASDISENRVDGIRLLDSVCLGLVDNRIAGNRYYGIALQDGCYKPLTGSFTGQIFGSNNYIPVPDQEDGNQRGALCPVYPGNPWPEGLLKEQQQ